MKGGREGGGGEQQIKGIEKAVRKGRNQTENEVQKNKRQPRYCLRGRGSEWERERELVLFSRQKNSGGGKRRRDFDRSTNLSSHRERQPAKEQSEASRERTPHHPIFRTRTKDLLLSRSRAITPTHPRRLEIWNGVIVALLQAAEQTEQQSGWCNAAGPLSSIVLLRSFSYSNLRLFLLSRLDPMPSSLLLSPDFSPLYSLSHPPPPPLPSLSLPLSLSTQSMFGMGMNSMLLRLLHLHFYYFNWYIYNKANGITN